VTKKGTSSALAISRYSGFFGLEEASFICDSRESARYNLACRWSASQSQNDYAKCCFCNKWLLTISAIDKFPSHRRSNDDEKHRGGTNEELMRIEQYKKVGLRYQRLRKELWHFSHFPGIPVFSSRNRPNLKGS
jgi:hypothetical protein